MTAKPSDRTSRIGVFGGTFDPVHRVHVRIAEAARAFAHLDRVLFVVAAQPPHKSKDRIAEGEHRFAMVEAALRERPQLEASRIELDREGPSYTIDTLETVSEKYPDADLYLIVGKDSLVDLPNWHRANDILDRAHLLVVDRPGDYRIPDTLTGKFSMVPFDPEGESSTEIRQQAASGASIEDRVPGEAAALIREHGLYDDARDAQSK